MSGGESDVPNAARCGFFVDRCNKKTTDEENSKKRLTGI